MKDKGKNLKPFKRGADPRRNLKGRPKSLPGLDVVLLDVLGHHDRMKKIVEAIARKALRGDLKAAELLLDRVYGKLTQSIQAQVELENPITKMLRMTNSERLKYIRELKLKITTEENGESRE